MIDFATFSVTLPYPTIEAILIYWIIGQLVAVFASWHACMRHRFAREIVSESGFFELLRLNFSVAFAWPWVAISIMREKSK